MLAMTELKITADATGREPAPRVVLAPRLQLLPPLSETAPRPQVARPTVDEDDFDSMWEEGVASW